MKRLMRWLWGAVVFSLMTANSDTHITSDFFPYAQGWMGGDAAYSILLDAQTTVWLFGDTFIGAGRSETMIHNSIAKRTCSPGCEVTYWWQGKKSGKPDAFFATPETNYFWPLDGLVHGGTLYVFLEQMHVAKGGGAMGFDWNGVTLATVANPFDSPDRWRIQYREIARGNSIIPGVAVAEEGSTPSFLDVFTLLRGDPQHPFVGLWRIGWQELTQPDQQWQYLTASGRWLGWDGKGVPEGAAAVLPGNITEMSVKFHAGSRRWVAMFPSAGFPSSSASFCSAKNLRGPWSPAQAIFRYPEMIRGNAHYTPNVFCYAAKEHPELERSGKLAFTYACNSMKEAEIFKDMGLYRPQLVEMAYPAH